MEAGQEDDDRDNFLDRFRRASGDAAAGEGDDEAGEDAEAHSQVPLESADRNGRRTLPVSRGRLRCQECGMEDQEDGGGHYGTDDHKDLFFCGVCWKSWDSEDKESVDRREPTIFEHYKDAEGTDDIDGAWDPSSKDKDREGEMALPGSWERPQCFECGRDEGAFGGGRYGHGEDSDKFFCGRCWMSWDEVDRRRMMMSYAPRRACDPMDPMLCCPPPPLPMLDDEGLWGRPAWQEEETSEERQEDAEQAGIDGADGTPGNFFEQYGGGQGSGGIEGSWDPSQRERQRGGEMALPGSWRKPLCVECGRDEGEEGRGRYGHGPESEKFYCGRCWMSWEQRDRDKMMRAYAPSRRLLHGGYDEMDPMMFFELPKVHCGPPDEDEDLFEEASEEEEEEDFGFEGAGAAEGAAEEYEGAEGEWEEVEDDAAEDAMHHPATQARGMGGAESSDDAECAD